jgi:basic membrane protein A
MTRRRAVLLAALSIVVAGSAAAPSGSTPLLKVAYVIPISAAPDPHDLYGAALLGFERAVKRFHVAARVVQFDPKEGATPTLTKLARERYDLIMVGEVRGGPDAIALVAVARRFPGVKFVFTDPPVLAKWPKNLQGSIWRVEQPAYLAGYLAGLMERRRPGKDVVGSVGGFPIPTVQAFIVGFEAGARAADPGIKLLRGYTNDFLNSSRCRSVALSEIAKGAGVVFNVAGLCGLGTLDAARASGVWGVGVDVDQSFLGPHILTSVLKRFDMEVYETVQALVEGRLKTGGNAVWDLHNDGVGLGKISPRVPRSVVAAVERVRKEIAAGKITVPSA